MKRIFFSDSCKNTFLFYFYLSIYLSISISIFSKIRECYRSSIGQFSEWLANKIIQLSSQDEFPGTTNTVYT